MYSLPCCVFKSGIGCKLRSGEMQERVKVLADIIGVFFNGYCICLLSYHAY